MDVFGRIFFDEALKLRRSSMIDRRQSLLCQVIVRFYGRPQSLILCHAGDQLGCILRIFDF